MTLIGCTPPGRNTEQHDVFFGIGNSIKDLVPDTINFWPEPKLHFDAWREITHVNGFSIQVKEGKQPDSSVKLFFLNLGGYKQNEFEEYHYKMLAVANDKGEAVRQAKKTAFFRHTGFKGANSHIDDKYGVDVDDVYAIADILPPALKDRYSLLVTPAEGLPDDKIYLGYFRLDSVDKWPAFKDQHQ